MSDPSETDNTPPIGQTPPMPQRIGICPAGDNRWTDSAPRRLS